MSVKPDRWIHEMVLKHDMINPFEEKQVRNGNISYGLSSYGYDMRLSDDFKIFSPPHDTVLDPKKLPLEYFHDYKGPECIIPPHNFILGKSIEYFKIPRNVLTLCTGKSTYARCGIFLNVTPFEPEWEGFVTISIANTGSNPAKLYAGEGIAQVIFFTSDENCAISYADRKGKYQAQKDIKPPDV
ncbi:MAG: dCTP deaminase [Candidatus Schekmanbacteria bacterium RBG_13_48_7]|uniref:dCTP deaminase n=1 Tax=Candidatus Schekmanbacteria bacterium RBG_13_48_7 TaxID=1817878 RepID=A0A1F7RLK4_9BACT|nr:MAG: dCTP deaminase [Candidatus Schekmanbacteria bacterium RBG_13_48_7]